MRPFCALLLLLVLPTVMPAQTGAKVPDSDPEVERKSFIVADGFEVNLYASDPLLAKPIQMNFDNRGRLWVATSEVYPQIAPGQKANDKIVILEDTKKVGKADKVTVFKKRRRHKYRRKAGHRQQHTIIEIVSIGGQKAEKKPEAKVEAKPAATAAAPVTAEAPAKAATKVAAPAKAEKPVAAKAPAAKKPVAKAEKPVAAKAPAAEKAPTKSTKDATPAKAAAKKVAPKAPAKPKK